MSELAEEKARKERVLKDFDKYLANLKGVDLITRMDKGANGLKETCPGSTAKKQTFI